MYKFLKRVLALALIIISFQYSSAQNCSKLNMKLESEIASQCGNITMTMIHDQKGRDYLYVANKSLGLTIYDISNIASPVPVDTISPANFGGLDVMNLSQQGNCLYLAIGNHFTNPQKGGIAVVDVTDPAQANTTDYYVHASSLNGAGIVKTEGNYAYLGAMKSGLLIFDISDKDDIKYVSQFIPDINYPVNSPNPDLYNARGMEVKNSVVYLAYDAGGFRIINCSNKSKPIETGRYVNPTSYKPFNLPRAYNNLILDDTLIYMTVDYCGLEVLHIKDTSNIQLHGWWNPYNCPSNNWFTSPSHTNEIQFNKNCEQLFISTGKSDMVVLDVSDPSQPDSCNFYGGVNNSIGTWGVGLYEDQIYLSYICAFVPFSSNWTGVKILSYTPCNATVDPTPKNGLKLYPNPSHHEIILEGPVKLEKSIIKISNSMGQAINFDLRSENNRIYIEPATQKKGIYFLEINQNGLKSIQKFIIW